MSRRFDTYSKKSIVKDLKKLSFDYIPRDVVHRDEVIDKMFHLMRRIVDQNIAQNILIKGPVGTGKTVVSHIFCKDFSSYAKKNQVNLKCAFVNCRQRNTEASVLLKILAKYDPYFPDRGFSTTEMLEILRKNLIKNNERLIVVLDEVDVLLKRKGSDLIYAFTRFAEDSSRDTNISLMLISQKSVFDMMDISAVSTFKRSNLINFGKYDKKQLKDIVEHRIGLAFHPETVSPDTIELIADIASEWGDARYAIELLEKGALSCDSSGREMMLPEDVRKARADTYSTFSPGDLKPLNRPLKLAFLGMARALGDSAYVTTGDAEKEYHAVCEEFGETPRGHTQFWSYIQKLDAMGFIVAEKSGEGIQGKTTMISLPDVPVKQVVKTLERQLSKN